MNRLVLIGNGFDLAHGLKTSYADFINWYWREWGNKLMTSSKTKESDEFCYFELTNNLYHRIWYTIPGYYYGNTNPDPNDFIQRVKNDTNLCKFMYESAFFEQIDACIEIKGWVDLEHEYYSMLIQDKYSEDQYQILNKQLDFLRGKLIEYLNSEKKNIYE